MVKKQKSKKKVIKTFKEVRAENYGYYSINTWGKIPYALSTWKTMNF